METIRRKTLLYRSGIGSAGYCVNHVLGCSHGCRFPCYAFMMKRSYNQVRSYEEWCAPKLVENALELLDREIPKLKHKIPSVQLCLATDPFMYGHPEVTELSLKIIEKLNANGIRCTTLTKGVVPKELGDETRFSRENEYGISLVSLDEDFRKRWEPGAAPYPERIAALRLLHDKGCAAYVHMEPYPTPNIVRQDLRTVLEAVSFADRLWLGGWNYNPIVKKFAAAPAFYAEQQSIFDGFCRERGKE